MMDERNFEILMLQLDCITEVLYKISAQLEDVGIPGIILHNDEPSGAPQQPCMYN